MELPQLNWKNGKPWSTGDKLYFKPLGLKSVKAKVVEIYDITEDECYLVVETTKNKLWYVPSSQCQLSLASALRFEHLIFNMVRAIREERYVSLNEAQ